MKKKKKNDLQTLKACRFDLNQATTVKIESNRARYTVFYPKKVWSENSQKSIFFFGSGSNTKLQVKLSLRRRRRMNSDTYGPMHLTLLSAMVQENPCRMQYEKSYGHFSSVNPLILGVFEPNFQVKASLKL